MQGSCGSEGTGSIYLPFPHAKRLNCATQSGNPAGFQSLGTCWEQSLVYPAAQSHGSTGGEQIGAFQKHPVPAAQCHQAEMVAQGGAKVAVPVCEFVPVKTWKQEESSRALRRGAGGAHGILSGPAEVLHVS